MNDGSFPVIVDDHPVLGGHAVRKLGSQDGQDITLGFNMGDKNMIYFGKTQKLPE